MLRCICLNHPRSLIHEADIAAVGVRALTEDGHNKRAYHLTGPQRRTILTGTDSRRRGGSQQH